MTRAPLTGSDLHSWIALRRVSYGRVAKAGSYWIDGGFRVPGYVADTLAAFCDAGLVALTDLDKTGMARLTGAGADLYNTLCQRRREALWVPAAQPGGSGSSRAATNQIGVLVAVCGQRMPRSAPTSDQPAGQRCPTCEALAAVPESISNPHNTPDAGRPSVEHAPGGRPDTTAPAESARPAADADRRTAHQGEAGTWVCGPAHLVRVLDDAPGGC